MALKLKAVRNKKSGARFEGDDLTEFIVDFALNNRDQFDLVYTSDTVEPAEAGAASPNSEIKVWSEAELKDMDKTQLLGVAASLGLDVEGNPTEADLIEVILSIQEE